MQTPAQLSEDLSEGLAIAQRKVEATRQDLIKEATNFLEVKADQRAQQKAIISNLPQVSLSDTHTTITFLETDTPDFHGCFMACALVSNTLHVGFYP